MPAKLHKGSRFLADYTEIVTGLCAVNPEAAERGIYAASAWGTPGGADALRRPHDEAA